MKNLLIVMCGSLLMIPMVGVEANARHKQYKNSSSYKQNIRKKRSYNRSSRNRRKNARSNNYKFSAKKFDKIGVGASGAMKFLAGAIGSEALTYGAKRVYGRVRNSNTIEYRAPTKYRCGYVTTSDWTGRITYKRVCK